MLDMAGYLNKYNDAKDMVTIDSINICLYCHMIHKNIIDLGYIRYIAVPLYDIFSNYSMEYMSRGNKN